MQNTGAESGTATRNCRVIEYPPRPSHGRLYRSQRRVRLSDAGSDGSLRPDGFARYLQDVAGDDWADSGLDPKDTWVVRRTALRVADEGGWPQLGEDVALCTWCCGAGAAWAERRTDLEIGGRRMLEAVALWVALDGMGRPVRLGGAFNDVYGETIAGRRVPSRVESPPPPPADAHRSVWTIRRSDLDVVGHVNNAAVWAALVEVLPGVLLSAELTHLAPLQAADKAVILTRQGAFWLLIEDEIGVFARYRAT